MDAAAVTELIRREVGVVLGSATVGRYLRRWGFDEGDAPGSRRATIEPAIARGAAPAAVEELRVAWTRPCLPLSTEPAYALVAANARGVLHFLAAERPFDVDTLHDLRHRLRMQLARDVRLVVCAWPPEHTRSLDGWQSSAREAATRRAAG
ncbi:hypothetical protein BJF78_32005 [Pseudonocardia sp. CNS-139]|nr:hypothetical protein BJF78_32005 [Pseudonocardia sp. CNS-139]